MQPFERRFYLIYVGFISKIENLNIAHLSSEIDLQTSSFMCNIRAANKYGIPCCFLDNPYVNDAYAAMSKMRFLCFYLGFSNISRAALGCSGLLWAAWGCYGISKMFAFHLKIQWLWRCQCLPQERVEAKFESLHWFCMCFLTAIKIKLGGPHAAARKHQNH